MELISKKITGRIIKATPYTFLVKTDNKIVRVKRRTLGGYLIKAA